MICEKCGSSDVKKLRRVMTHGVKFYMYQCQNCGAIITSRMYTRYEQEDGAPPERVVGNNFWVGCLVGVVVVVILVALAFKIIYPLLALRFR
jgi:hypothetical protein